jgi:hypothetical protein
MLVAKLVSLLKIENLFILDLKKKKMLQKNTNYNIQLKLIPNPVKEVILQTNKQDLKQKIAHLVFLDMLHLLKM